MKKNLMDRFKKASKEIVSANILKVSVAQTGYMGGDAGHGGYVKIEFEDISSTCMQVNGVQLNKFNISFLGDSERDTLIEALKFVLSELEE